MSVTSIQFIGLFVVMMNSGAGLHILLPHFPGTPYADHTSVIQYSPDQVSSATWPGVTNCGPDNTLRCAPINLETISFSGASDPSPTDVIGDIPHLSCCCTTMTRILRKYRDPNSSARVSAHFFITQGVAEALPAANGRTDTWVTMHSTDPDGITVTAVAADSSSFNIVFKPGAQITIMNTTTPSSSSNHFLAYYLMGRGSSTCTSIPTGGAPCAASGPVCAIARKQRSKTFTRNIAAKKRSGPPSGTLEVDADCANSHWP